MRLHRHDELVEAMARAITEAPHRDQATAALDALLQAAVELGVAEIADVDGIAKPYSIIALRLEASNDK